MGVVPVGRCCRNGWILVRVSMKGDQSQIVSRFLPACRTQTTVTVPPEGVRAERLVGLLPVPWS